MEAVAIPFPREESTPPTTKIYFAIYPLYINKASLEAIFIVMYHIPTSRTPFFLNINYTSGFNSSRDSLIA